MVKSSTISAVRPSTSPIRSTTSADSAWSARSLSAIASGALSRRAYRRAFLANPASGETTTRSASVLGGDGLAQHGQRVQVVDGDAEEALDLRRVQVHGDHPVGAGGLDGVGADPGADRHPRLVLLVALGVAEVRDDGRDRRRAGALERVDPEQQLHEVVVDRERGALDDEDVAAAHVLEHPDEQVAVAEAQGLALAERVAEVVGDGSCELRVGGAGQEHEVVHSCEAITQLIH